MAKLKYVVETKDKDGNAITLAILMPSAKVKHQAQLIRARYWAEAVKGGAIMREVLEQYLRDQGIWDDAREAEFRRIRDTLLDNKVRLDKGGIRKSEGRAIALEMRNLRDEYSRLLSQRNRVDANTADAIADQAQFNYFVAACTVYNDSQKPYFTFNNFDPSLESYVERAGEDAAVAAATKLAEVMYGTEEDLDSKLPENEFLRKYGYADEKNRLIDSERRLVSEDGKLINDDGRYVNEAGEFVDKDGKKVDENGNYVVEFSPFLDDDDQPVVGFGDVKFTFPVDGPVVESLTVSQGKIWTDTVEPVTPVTTDSTQ
jgi:hypothetical protein